MFEHSPDQASNLRTKGLQNQSLSLWRTGVGAGRKLYASLPLPTPHSIRVLTIIPGDTADDIRCKMRVYRLEQAPAYEALSYVWGASDPPVRIKCNVFFMNIGPNLGEAIRRLRRPLRRPRKLGKRVVWIDALCS